MQIIEPYAKIVVGPKTRDEGMTWLMAIERFGRTAYRSEDKITDSSCEKFIRMLMERGHLSVIEHCSVSVEVVCDRGVSHEIVRHRLASYTQESTRYCNYGKNGEIKVIRPPGLRGVPLGHWIHAMENCERRYLDMTGADCSPQIARSVLPNSLATKLIWTQNLRAWRHTLIERTSRAAHPQMRQIMIPLLSDFQERLPFIYDDVVPEDDPAVAKRRLQ